MNFQLFDWLKPAEGETTARTYHCTTLRSRLLNLKAEGYLIVTNKRVVFHATGSSYTGDSILQSEVPIEDVSGLTCYSGGYFSISHLLVAFFASIVIGVLVNLVIVGGLLQLIYERISENFSFDSMDSINNTLIGVTVLFWVLAIGLTIYSSRIPKDRIQRPILASLGAIFLAELGGLGIMRNFASGFLFGQSGNSQETMAVITTLLAVGTGIYAAVCMFWYAVRKTMSLYVGSKGGSNSPIAISGIRSFGAAGHALGAEPAEDAEAMIKQIGAMIKDIQQLGEIGFEKWKSGEL